MKLLFQFSSILLTSLLALQPLSAQAPVSVALADLQLHLVSKDAGKGFTVQVTDASGSGVADAAVVLRLPDEGPSGKFPDGSRAAIAYTDASGQAQLPAIQWNAASGSLTFKLTATKGTAHAAMLVDQPLTGAPAAAAPISVPAAPAAPVPAAPAPAPAATPVSRAKPSVSVSQPGALDRSSSRPAVPTNPPQEPVVTVTNGPSANREVHNGGSSHKKWIILAVVIAAGAGAGIAMAGKGKSSTASTTSSSLSIGSPTVSVGHP